MTVNSSDTATFFWREKKLDTNLEPVNTPPYITETGGASEPSTPVLLFPHRCLLKEFRIQPTAAWDTLVSVVRVTLFVDGNPLVDYNMTLAVDGNANLLFKLEGVGGADTLSPGSFVWLNLRASGVSGHDNSYQFSMWGTWVR